MTNHVHLPLKPSESSASLAQLMKRVAARHTHTISRHLISVNLALFEKAYRQC